MEHLFSGIEPPKRSDEEKQKSLQAIKHGMSVKKKKYNWPYYSVLTAAVAVLFILIASLQTATPNSVHLTTGAAPEVKNIYMFNQTDLDDEPRTFMSKWYNFDKVTFEKEEIASLLPAISRLQKVEGVVNTGIDKNYTALIIQYDDGVEQFYAIDFDFKQLVNISTKEIAQLEQSELTTLLTLKEELQDGFPMIVNFFAIGIALVAYFYFILKISPIRKIKLEENNKPNRKIFISSIGYYLLITFLLGFSSFYYGAFNLLFIASFFGLFFILQLFIRRFINGQPYSYWEIPLSTFTFTCLTIIYTL